MRGPRPRVKEAISNWGGLACQLDFSATCLWRRLVPGDWGLPSVGPISLWQSSDRRVVGSRGRGRNAVGAGAICCSFLVLGSGRRSPIDRRRVPYPVGGSLTPVPLGSWSKLPWQLGASQQLSRQANSSRIKRRKVHHDLASQPSWVPRTDDPRQNGLLRCSMPRLCAPRDTEVATGWCGSR